MGQKFLDDSTNQLFFSEIFQANFLFQYYMPNYEPKKGNEKGDY